MHHPDDVDREILGVFDDCRHPTYRYVADEVGVSTSTVMRRLHILAEQGLVEVHDGRIRRAVGKAVTETM